MPGWVRFPQPYMQVVVVQAMWHERFMTGHWPVEGLTKQGGPLLDAGGQGDQPFHRHKPQLITARLIYEDRLAHRVRYRTDELRIHKMHAHTARRIRHSSSTAGLRIVHATHYGAVAIANRHIGVLVLF